MSKPFKKNRIVRQPRKDRADVLMVYPVWVKKQGRGKLQRMLPPLGVLSIASYLEQHGYEVHVVDLHAEELSTQEFREIVRALKPRFVGITVLSAHFVPANNVAKICKDEVADVKVFVGGVHAEAHPEQMLANPCIDAVGRGDGEELMLELVGGLDYEKVDGLSYRTSDGHVVHNKGRKVEMDLDRYPFPAYHLIDFDNYFPPAGTYKDLPAMNVLMTRGCPGKCTFCNSANTVLRRRSVEKMVELIKLLRYEYGIRHVYFYDDTFTANPRIVEQFCERMIADKVDVKWTCYVRGDMFREKIAALMARAGCHHVMLGVESGSDSLMAKIGKPIDKAKYKEAVKLAQKHGIETRGSFIIGHLDETHETMRETVDFAIEMGLDFFQLNIMTPYPGTQLFKWAKENGALLHENYSIYGQNEVVLKLKHLEPDEVIAFEKQAFYRFYLRPKAIWQQLKRLSNIAQVKDLAKAAYIILGEGLTQSSSFNKNLQEWIANDAVHSFVKSTDAEPTPKLTWQVRQTG